MLLIPTFWDLHYKLLLVGKEAIKIQHGVGAWVIFCKYDFSLNWTMQALKLGKIILIGASVVLYKEWLQPSNDLFLNSV